MSHDFYRPVGNHGEWECWWGKSTNWSQYQFILRFPSIAFGCLIALWLFLSVPYCWENWYHGSSEDYDIFKFLDSAFDETCNTCSVLNYVWVLYGMPSASKGIRNWTSLQCANPHGGSIPRAFNFPNLPTKRPQKFPPAASYSFLITFHYVFLYSKSRKNIIESGKWNSGKAHKHFQWQQ